MTTGTLFSATLGLNSNDWNGYTFVQSIPASAMTLPSGSIIKVRFRLQSSTTETRTVTNAYIEHRAGAGDVYDFNATPVQLLFAGSGSKVIASNSEEWTDWATFAYNKTDDLLFATYCGGGTSSDNLRYSNSVTGCAAYYKSGNDSSTVNKSGYTLQASNFLGLVNAIEYETSDGGGSFFPFF